MFLAVYLVHTPSLETEIVSSILTQEPPSICGYVGNGIQDGLKNHCFAHAGSNPATHTTIKMGWFFTNDSTPEELFTDETMIGVYNEFINEMLHNRENADIEKIL